MKISNYKSFMLNEQNEQNEINNIDSVNMVIIKHMEQSLAEMNQLESQIDQIDDIEDLIDDIETAYKSVPETFRKAIIYGIRLAFNNDYRKLYSVYANKVIEKLKSGEDYNKMSKEEWHIKYMEDLGNLMQNILKIDNKELEELYKRFFAGASKFNKSKEESRKVSSEDPYGEEEWDGMSDEDRLKKSFEDE